MADCFEELISAVKHSFQLYVREKITDVFLTPRSVLERTLPVNSKSLFKHQHRREIILQMPINNISTQLVQMIFITQCVNAMKKFVINSNILSTDNIY